MNIEAILKFVCEETPGHAKELWSAIELVFNTIENTKLAIDGSIGKLLSNREYKKAEEYMHMSKDIAELIDVVNEYTKKYALQEDSTDDVIEDDEDDVSSSLITDKVNYEKYRVDENIAYNIYTDFTYTKPAAFTFNGKKYYVRKWQYLFVNTCELLVDLDSDKFASFINDETMQGRTRLYFSLDEKSIRKPKKIKNTNVYVETNLSANNIRNIIVNMLEKYGISKSQFQIYLSKDLSPLHSENNNGTKKTGKCKDDSDGEYHI